MPGRSGKITKRSSRQGLGTALVYPRRVPKPRAAFPVLLLFAALSLSARAALPLTMYFIDVEGGQSTLIVTPAGEPLLVDTGYAGNGDRDARRLLAAASAAGVTKIDYLLIN